MVTGGIAAPENFVFPLNWANALTFDTPDGGAERIALDSGSRSALRKAADAISDIEISGFPDPMDFVAEYEPEYDENDEQPPEFIYFLGKVAVLPFATVLWANRLLLNFMIESSDFRDDLAEAFDAAADEDFLTESVADLLSGLDGALTSLSYAVTSVLMPVAYVLDGFGWDEEAQAIRESADFLTEGVDKAIFGLTRAEMDIVRHSLMAEYQRGTSVVATWDDGVMDNTSLPVIQLGPAMFSFYFGGYESDYAPEYDNGKYEEPNAWENDFAFKPGWLRRANPTLQFAFELNLAAEILIQALNAECALLGLTDLANVDGPTGTLFREQASTNGFACLTSVLGGVSLARVIAILYRQTVADSFLGGWELENGGQAAAPCVVELFCWMRAEAARDAIDAMLGKREVGALARDFSTGLFTKFLSGEGLLCDKWSALACADREAIRDFVQSQDCAGTAFDDVVIDGSSSGGAGGDPYDKFRTNQHLGARDREDIDPKIYGEQPIDKERAIVTLPAFAWDDFATTDPYDMIIWETLDRGFEAFIYGIDNGQIEVLDTQPIDAQWILRTRYISMRRWFW